MVSISKKTAIEITEIKIRKETLMKILRWTARIFSLLTGVLTVSLFVFLLLYTLVLPLIFHIKPFIVLSGSMEPEFKAGSVVLVDLDRKEPAVGDVITYRLPEEGLIVTHRIIREEGGRYITKGDANEVEDFLPVEKEMVLGTYRFQIPGLGAALEHLDKRLRLLIVGMLVLMNLASLLLLKAAEEEDMTANRPDGRIDHKKQKRRGREILQCLPAGKEHDD